MTERCQQGHSSRISRLAVREHVGCRVGAVEGQASSKTCSGHAFQVAQTTSALHWIVKTLRDGSLGLEEGIPTLGEWGPCQWLGPTSLCPFSLGI